MKKVVKSILILGTVSIIGSGCYLIYQNNSSADGIQVETKRLVNLGSFNSDSPEYARLIAEAKTLTEQNKLTQAIQKYLEAFKIDNRSNLPLIGIAEIYLLSDNLNYAEQNLIKAQTKAPLDLKGRIIATRLALNNQNLELAKQFYDSIEGSDTESLVVGSILYFLLQNDALAEEKVNSIISQNKDDKYSQIAKDLKTQIDIYKTFTDSPRSYLYAILAKQLLNNNEYILARPLLQASIQQKNDYRDAWLMLGYSYLLSNKNNEAVRALEKAKQIDPYNADTFFYLGIAQQRNNQNKQAVENLQKASSFGFNNAKETYLQIANSFYLDKNYIDAEKYFTQASDLGELKIEDYTKAVWLNIDPLNNGQKAIKFGYLALNYYPQTAMAHNLVGWAQIKLKNYNEAEKFLNQAISLDPQIDAAYLNLGILNIELKNLEQAKSYLNKAIELANSNRSNSILNKANEVLNQLNQSNT